MLRTYAVHCDDQPTTLTDEFAAEFALDLRLDELDQWLIAGAPARQIVQRFAVVQKTHCQVHLV